jgi:hypothetical protein
MIAIGDRAGGTPTSASDRGSACRHRGRGCSSGQSDHSPATAKRYKNTQSNSNKKAKVKGGLHIQSTRAL